MKKSTSLNRLFLTVIVFIFCSSANAQVIDLHPTPNRHIDYSRLKRIDDVINDYIKKGWEKAVVTIIVKDNQLIQYNAYGYADSAGTKPLANNAIFRIMSQTKAIVSVAAMMLYEEGKFLLDQPIADFIPEFRKPTVVKTFNAADTTYTTVPSNGEITFRHLLTHTSGLDYPDIGNDTMMRIYAKANIPSGLGEFKYTLLDRMKALGKLPLSFQPGTQWRYGLNVDLLGSLIEVISGVTLDEFLRKRIFDPLGMADTYFNVPKDKQNRLTTVYTEDSLHHIIKWSHTHNKIDPDYPMKNMQYFSGGAGLSSTAYDYAIFLQMLLNGGTYNGRSILSPASVELMLRNQIGDIDFGGNKFGLGFALTTEKGAAQGPTSAGTFGWGGYFGTSYWADPAKKLVCLFMTQHNPNSHSDLGSKFEVLIYQALK